MTILLPRCDRSNEIRRGNECRLEFPMIFVVCCIFELLREYSTPLICFRKHGRGLETDESEFARYAGFLPAIFAPTSIVTLERREKIKMDLEETLCVQLCDAREAKKL